LCCHLLGDDLGLLSRQRDGYTASGDKAITGILLRTRAIIGSPK